MSGVFSPGRAKIKERTLRTDKWWIEPAITFGVLFSFIIYATFRAFEGANYYKDHLISPFYSPCLSQACVPEATIFGFTPVSAEIFNFALSPALIILIFPLGFRMTCITIARLITVPSGCHHLHAQLLNHILNTLAKLAHHLSCKIHTAGSSTQV